MLEDTSLANTENYFLSSNFCVERKRKERLVFVSLDTLPYINISCQSSLHYLTGINYIVHSQRVNPMLITWTSSSSRETMV